MGDSISTAGDNISAVEGIQLSEGRILISACLVINNDEKISTFFVLRYEIFVRKFFEDSSRFHALESWTGVLQVHPCFEIIDNFIFGVLCLSFTFNCLCDCR